MPQRKRTHEALALLGLGHRRGHLDRPDELLLHHGSPELFPSCPLMEMKHLIAIVLWGLTLTVPMDSKDGACVLDQAQIIAIPPDTFRVLVSWWCGEKACWTRWIETKGVRRGESHVCEGQGDALSITGS